MVLCPCTYRFVSEEEQKQKLVKENGRLQQQVKELQGAMQELGAEFQSLQLIHSRAIERKWDKDKDIIACTGCRRNFTVSTRRVREKLISWCLICILTSFIIRNFMVMIERYMSHRGPIKFHR
jgi:hypothetical protein